MILYPNAKINLGLNIVQKRNDGYHELETVMIPIPLYDILEITESVTFEYFQSGNSFDGELEENLCVKAYRLIAENYKIPAVRIHLRKQIPIGAGLGGGSSDATFVVRGLNKLFDLNISISDQEKLVSILGSDCAFFVQNIPQLATGRGELLKPIRLDLSNYSIHLIFPKIHISTKTAYSDVQISGNSGLLESTISQPIANWQEIIENDFEKHIFEMHPILAHYKNNLLKQGAIYASMSGSGSSIFGIFESDAPFLKLHPENSYKL